jgi:integrase
LVYGVDGMAKNTVKIESLRGNLRLRWSYQGERYCMSLGLYDSPLARTVAEGKVSIIEADLTTGNFDVTLKKYQREVADDRPLENGLTVAALFGQFFQHKGRKLTGNTHARYKALDRKIAKHFGAVTVASVDEEGADRFRAWLAEELKPISQVQYLNLMNACWAWGIKQGNVTTNPWVEVSKIKVPPQQRPRPFTAVEMSAIINGFKSNRYYTDFVTFLFGTGCRTGEAIGLQWCHLSEGYTKVWIGESVSRGKRKATKTNKAREFKLPSYLVTLLLTRQPVDAKPTDLVFPALEGGPIDAQNFRNRAWTSVLEQAGVTYRKPYSTRHTFISHALAKGVNPMLVAEMTGHDPETLFKYYAADIQGGLQCPDIFA